MATIGAAGCSGGDGERAAPDPAAGSELQASPEALLPHGAVILPGNTPLFGKSITRWGEDWWHWMSTVPASDNPDLNLDAGCNVDQDGPLFFIPTYIGSTSYVRVCDVPLGKPVLVPVQVVLNEYPCPDPSFQPAPGQTLEDFLRQGAVQYNDLYRDLVAAVDTQTIDLTKHRHTTSLFINTADRSLLPRIPDPCLTGTPQPVVSDGWWLVLLLPPGHHDVRVTGTRPDDGATFDRDYQLHVRWN